MAEITLASGVVAWVDKTSHVLFGRKEWPYYDGIPERDPYRILPDDVQVTVSMNSFVSDAGRVREVHRGMAREWIRYSEKSHDADLLSFDPDLSLPESCSTQLVLRVECSWRWLQRSSIGSGPATSQCSTRSSLPRIEHGVGVKRGTYEVIDLDEFFDLDPALT